MTSLAAGERLARVYRRGQPTMAFNPGHGCGRFHPVFTVSGKPIPTLYMDQTLQSALLETVLRLTPKGSFLSRGYLSNYEYSWITIRHALKLIDLRGLALRALGLARAHLLDSAPDTWALTARWAEALHRAGPKAHGMVWRSRQIDTADVFLLFGDRVSARDLKADDETYPLDEGRGFERVLRLADTLGVVVTEA